ncbi:hypothetical protein C8A05DRAFT_29816 [Staphylotrichum tortipilum]|uniref:Uncharacterized protein n=1 Tax=Staphylotrichum tortipilum TaxID=2831512 RepID=A0AAN6MU27_9PEZI|nr:hypothetical protein C8A05DRAFT_29816 [Staphylotrichum longicolle]
MRLPHVEAIWHYFDSDSPDALNEAELADLGVVRSTDLNVDSPSPVDPEPRFFAPCHGELSGLMEALATWEPHWRLSLDIPEHLRDDEWIPNAGYVYASVRLDWFSYILHLLRREYKDEPHPVYPAPSRQLTPSSGHTYNAFDSDEMDFKAPIGYCGRYNMYQPAGCVMAAAPDKPHIGMYMLSPIVAPHGKVLESELMAAVACPRLHLRARNPREHHPGHFDTEAGKIVVRQSRQLDVVGAEGRPPPDTMCCC